MVMIWFSFALGWFSALLGENDLKKILEADSILQALFYFFFVKIL